MEITQKNLFRAMSRALAEVATPQAGSSALYLKDEDIPRFSKATLIYALREQMERDGVSIPLEMFSPFFIESSAKFFTRTSLSVFLDRLLESMTLEFTPRMSSLLESYSPRGGTTRSDGPGRLVTYAEIQRISECMEVEQIVFMMRNVIAAVCA